MSKADLIEGIAGAARRWLEIDYPVRVKAIESTLAAPNRFTEEAIHFATNQQMHQLTVKNMVSWLGKRGSTARPIVGVLNPGNVPLAGLQDYLAVILAGAAYRGCVSSKSPFLLPEFSMDLMREAPSVQSEFVSRDEVFAGVHKAIVTGGDSALAWARKQAVDAGIGESELLFRGPGIGIAVLDGEESEDDMECLAEDCLLHEGMGCRSVAVIWAPAGMEPDPLLEAFANFRSVFPAHPETGGTLEMQRAYLAATNQPHAYAEDKSFLMSKGKPEPQAPGHIRWSEYDNREEMLDWLSDWSALVQVVVSRNPERIDDSRSCFLGTAQRPPLGWLQSGRDTIDFVTS